jgi:hypothetical protein
MKTTKQLALSLSFVVGVTALCAALVCVTQLSAATPPASRTSDSGGVRVVITPKTVEPGAAVWEFEVVMDTHTKPLNEDLVGAAVLIDDTGRQHVPLAWQGDPPGGHHRKGILKFALPMGRSKIIELQISGVGGPGKRVFRWEIN